MVRHSTLPAVFLLTTVQLILVVSWTHLLHHLVSPAVLLLTTLQLLVVSCGHLVRHSTLPAVLLLTTVQPMLVVSCGHLASTSLNITSGTFTNNSAADGGGVAYIVEASSFNIIVGSSFYANKANSYGGIIVTTESSTHIANSTFDYNSGSLYIFNSNLNFSGYTRLENCAEQANKTAGAREEGGAITSFQLTVIFYYWSKQFIKQPSKAWWSNISHRK